MSNQCMPSTAIRDIIGASSNEGAFSQPLICLVPCDAAREQKLM